MNRLVFVSTELAPFTHGVIGQTMSELLRALDDADRSRTTLLMVDATIDSASFTQEFPGVEIVEVDTRIDQGRFLGSRQHPPASAYSNTQWHWRSACVYRALSQLSQNHLIDYLEFADLGGLAFCTLQECRLQGFLSDATLAIRLHGSHTASLHAEAQAISVADLNLSDIERKCVRDCDCVVAPSPAVSEAVRKMFDFPAHEWQPRVVCHIPPVSPDLGIGNAAVSASPEQALVFGSEFQRSGRPDLFVRAGVGLMRDRPLYRGAMVLNARDSDEAYRAQIERLVPTEFSPRVHFEMGAQEWKVAASRATVVFPSAFEVSGTAALQASIRGRRLILNAMNPEFGDGTLWKHGVNCLKFDGSTEGLVQALERNFDTNEPLLPVQYPQWPWPWFVAKRQRAKWRALLDQPKVSIVVPHHNLAAYLEATLNSLRAQCYSNFEIVLVDDASTDLDSLSAIEALAFSEDLRLKVVRLTTNVGLAAARNIGVRHSSGPYVLTLDADDLIHPRLLEVGVAALENNPTFDIVVTPAGYFSDGARPPEPGETATFSDYAMFAGEAVIAGLLENRFSTATALFRKAALEAFPYVESLNCYEDWSLFMRMCDADRRFLVTTDVFFFYRRRSNSMVHTPRDLSRKRIEYSDLLRTSAPELLRKKSRHLLLGLGAAVAGNFAEDGLLAAPPVSNTVTHDTIDGLFGPRGQHDEQVIFAALTTSRWLERKVPWLVRGLVGAARRMWQIYRAVRGSVGGP